MGRWVAREDEGAKHEQSLLRRDEGVLEPHKVGEGQFQEQWEQGCSGARVELRSGLLRREREESLQRADVTKNLSGDGAALGGGVLLL